MPRPTIHYQAVNEPACGAPYKNANITPDIRFVDCKKCKKWLEPCDEYDRGYAFGYNAAMDNARQYGRTFAQLNLRDLEANRSKDAFDRGYNEGFRAYLANAR